MKDSVEQYAALLRQSFALGEKHARAIIVDQLAVRTDDAYGTAYGKLLRAVDRLFPEEDRPPFDAGYAAGLAVGRYLAGGAR